MSEVQKLQSRPARGAGKGVEAATDAPKASPSIGLDTVELGIVPLTASVKIPQPLVSGCTTTGR
ncbi:hypothetical protein SAMN05428944_0353 [Streptomyces sp. 1222.5]|nr:hypothetical protein BX260_7743 [Streptomyces sp. 5112.2]SEB57247.1 hypothetical protein SAMN05428944_0353 [Streptomyces sp. 1222.5]